MTKESEHMVSIILSFYNEEKFISKAINSVFQQTYKNWELILLDDGSKDKTSKIIQRILKQKSYENNRQVDHVKYIRFPTNQGKGRNMNHGLKIAKGEYILELDGDDWFHPEALRWFVDEMTNRKEETAMLYSDYIILKKVVNNKRIKQKTELIKGKSIIDYNQWINDFFVPTPRFYRKKALLDIDGWPIDYPSNGRLYEDVAVIMKLLQTYQIAYLPKVTMYVRKHRGSTTKSNRYAWYPLFKILSAKYKANDLINEKDKGKPLVSLIVPFQNDALFLTYLLDSINNQNYKNIEILFVNDHSTDETLTIITSYLFRSDISYRLLYLEAETGKGYAIKKALDQVKGKYIMECSPYEVLYPEAIEILVDAIEGKKDDPLILGVYANRRLFQSIPDFKFLSDEINRPILTEEDFVEQNYLPRPYLLDKSNLIGQGGWDVDYLSKGMYYSEWMNIGLLLKRGKLHFVPRILSMHLQAKREQIINQDYLPIKKVIFNKLKRRI